MGNKPSLPSSAVAFLAGAAVATVFTLRRSTITGLPSSGAAVSSLVFAGLPIRAQSVLCSAPLGQAAAISGLDPVLPGHAVIVPSRLGVSRLSQLTSEELAAFFGTVRAAQRVVGAFEAGPLDFNIAIHEGEGAGQPVPHLHCHVVPRRPGDVASNDMIYELLQKWAPAVLVPQGGDRTPALAPPPDEDRTARTEATMSAEATRLAAAVSTFLHESGAAPAAALPAEPVAFGKFKLVASQVFIRSHSGTYAPTVIMQSFEPRCGYCLYSPPRPALLPLALICPPAAQD